MFANAKHSKINLQSLDWADGVKTLCGWQLAFSGLQANCVAIMQVYRCILFLLQPCFSHQCQVIHLVRLGALSTSCLCGECTSWSVEGETFPDAERVEGGPECGEGERQHHGGFPTFLQSWLSLVLSLGATKDMGKMLGGDEEKDPDAAKKEEERQEALRQEEEERKAKYAKMEAEREIMRQGIRDKVGIQLSAHTGQLIQYKRCSLWSAYLCAGYSALRTRLGKSLKLSSHSWKQLSLNKTMCALGKTSDLILLIQERSSDKDELFWWQSASCKGVQRIVLQIKKFGIMVLRK